MPDQVAPTKNKIIHASALVDGTFTHTSNENFIHYSLSLPVPPHHPRANDIKNTDFLVQPFSVEQFSSNSYFLLSPSMKNTFLTPLLGDRAHFVKSDESTLKEITWLDTFIENEIPPHTDTIIGVGGGILLNAAAYIAEKRHLAFVSVPTTILAAADAAIGGLVRINKVTDTQFQKSFYKSVYEPSQIILDMRFLTTLPKEQISFGLSEVIKHGAYQSLPLLKYLASTAFDPFGDANSLLKAICWTVALKNVAIIYDPDSLAFGGSILRGGHQRALAIEEASHFTVSHGEAVAVSVYQEMKENAQIVSLLDIIYHKLHLPKTSMYI